MTRGKEVVQLALNPGDSVKIESGQVTITRRRKPHVPFHEALRDDSLRKWWLETNMSNLFQEGAQVWINNRGAQIATAADVNIEQYGIGMGSDMYSEAIRRAFTRARGRSFTTLDIVSKLIGEAKELERKSAIAIEWSPDYVAYLIGILGDAWVLSTTRISELKSSLYKKRFVQFNQP